MRSHRAREEPFAERFDAVARGPAPEARAEHAENRARILRAVSALPPERARAIELAFFHGLTHVEVAERLKEPIGTVKTRIRLGISSQFEPSEGCASRRHSSATASMSAAPVALR